MFIVNFVTLGKSWWCKISSIFIVIYCMANAIYIYRQDDRYVMIVNSSHIYSHHPLSHSPWVCPTGNFLTHTLPFLKWQFSNFASVSTDNGSPSTANWNCDNETIQSDGWNGSPASQWQTLHCDVNDSCRLLQRDNCTMGQLKDALVKKNCHFISQSFLDANCWQSYISILSFNLHFDVI